MAFLDQVRHNEIPTFSCKFCLQFLNISQGKQISRKKFISSIFIKIKEKMGVFKEKIVIFNI